VIAERLPLPVARMRVVKEFEQRYIAALLAEHGTVAKAAAASGIARRYFQLLRGGRRREP
jgi:two-component system, NtrC family, response regulator HydG